MPIAAIAGEARRLDREHGADVALQGPGPSRCGPPHLPGHHRPLRRFPGAVAQRAHRLPVAATDRLADTIGAVRHPGIKIHDARVIRLLEDLLHGGTHVDGWTTKQVHHAVLTTFNLSERTYGLNQLRYDLHKLKGHACRVIG
jgi:hypothetical protein